MKRRVLRFVGGLLVSIGLAFFAVRNVQAGSCCLGQAELAVYSCCVEESYEMSYFTCTTEQNGCVANWTCYGAYCF
jgi:hypothetical protein